MSTTNSRAPTLLESIALGGASCVFTVNFTHPIELVKTRMQVSGDGLVCLANASAANIVVLLSHNISTLTFISAYGHRWNLSR